jgi:hypothetical protein
MSDEADRVPILALIAIHISTWRELFEIAATGDQNMKSFLLDTWPASIGSFAVLMHMLKGEEMDFEATTEEFARLVLPAA